MKINFIILTSILILLISDSSYGQVYANKSVGAKNQSITDSLKNAEYPYLLPIWGEKVSKMGIELPYSAGLSVNYFWQESSLIINNLYVGFNNGPKVGLDEVIRIDDATAGSNALNIRPDIWVLPFLNVYGIFAVAKTSTDINAKVMVPDSENNWTEIADFSSRAEFNATSFGLGLTPTVGVGGGWLALDMNMVWNDVDAVEDPVFTFVFGPRIGKTIKFKKPERNIAFWTGGFRLKLKSATKGSLDLADVLPVDGLQTKVDMGLEKLDIKQMEVQSWWDGLTLAEKTNPVNAAKYAAANRAFEAAGKLLTGLDGALSNAETSTVQYELTKQAKDKWNFILGSQFQINKHFMIRGEYGFLGSRNQFIGGLQYRFGL